MDATGKIDKPTIMGMMEMFKDCDPDMYNRAVPGVTFCIDNGNFIWFSPPI